MRAVCLTPQSCIASAVGSIWGKLADAIKEAVGQMVTWLFGWWTTTPSLDLNAPLVHTAQRYVTAWIAIPIAVLAVLAAVAWGVLGGGVAWVTDLARGMLVFGVVAAGSIPLVDAMQAWSTSLAKGLLSAVPTRDVGAQIIGLLDVPGMADVMVIFWGVVLLFASAIQYLLMLFRDGAVLVLTAVLPIAAAGQFNRGSVLWLPKIVGWLLAFIFLKPAAALIYYLGLSLVGQADGVQALATGVCVMISATFALPAMLRLVTFAVNSAPMGSGALGVAATGTGIAASVAQTSAMRRGGSAPSGAAPTGTAGAARAGGASPSGGGAAATGAGAAVAAASSVRRVPKMAVNPNRSTR